MRPAVQVNDVLLNTKDKKACVLLDLSIHNSKQENCCELLEVCGSSDGHTESVIAEIQAVYQVPSGVHA